MNNTFFMKKDLWLQLRKMKVESYLGESVIKSMRGEDG